MTSANPAPLGLCGLAFTLWLWSMINAGLFPPGSMSLVLACAFGLGGGAQFIAGLLEYPRANPFGLTAFCGYGSFWFVFALFIESPSMGMSPVFFGWFLLLWGMFSAALFVASLTGTRIMQLVFASLSVTFLLLAAGALSGNDRLHLWGGYSGLLTGAIAFYAAMALVINDAHRRVVLPVGGRA